MTQCVLRDRKNRCKYKWHNSEKRCWNYKKGNEKYREMGDEMYSDSFFNNTDVLGFQSTLAIQKSRKNTMREKSEYIWR